MKKAGRNFVLVAVAGLALTGLLAHYFTTVEIVIAFAAVICLAAGFTSRRSQHGFLGRGDARQRNEGGLLFAGATLVVAFFIILGIGSASFKSLNDGLTVYLVTAGVMGIFLMSVKSKK